MATPIEKIFNKFLNQIDDIELSLIENEDLIEVLTDHLENSIVEFNECSKDLTIINGEEKEYLIYEKSPFDIVSHEDKDNSIDEDMGVYYIFEAKIPYKDIMEFELLSETYIIDPDFTLNPQNNIDDNSFVEKKLEDGIDYKLSYDRETEIVTITLLKPFEDYTTVKLIYTTPSYIASDLTLEEIYILSLGMTLTWLSKKIKREENLKIAISDRDYKQSSPANLLSKLIDLSNHTRKELNIYKQRYSYKDFSGLS